MQLRLIYEVNLDRAISKVSPLLKTMPKKKRKHSKRVAKNLHKAGVKKVGIYTALLHDYLERGGDLFTLNQHINDLGLPSQIVTAIKSLSNDEKYVESHPNQPLIHLQSVLDGIQDEDLRNIIILAKLSDRLDNLRKRGRRISTNYKRKSADLVQWLVSQYSGKSKPIAKLLKGFEGII